MMERLKVLAIDPGPSQSAFVIWDGCHIRDNGIAPNLDILTAFCVWADCADVLVIEQIASYGMPVGKEVFETVFWSGRFAQKWNEVGNGECVLMPRLTVKMNLCHSARAKDSNVWAALCDRFGPPGTKKNPNPVTYGIKSHERAAFALAVTWLDEQTKQVIERNQ